MNNISKYENRSKNLISIFIIFLLFISSFTSPYIESFDCMEKIYMLLQCFCFFLGLFHFRKFDKLFILISFYYIIYFLSTVLNGGHQLMGIVRSYVVAFNLLIITKYYIEKNPKLFFNVASFFFITIIFIELITMLMYPNGLYDANNINPHYFLGHRNNTIEYLYPALSVFFLSSFVNNKKTAKPYILLLLCLVCVLFTWSANSILALFFTSSYIILSNNKYIVKIFNYKTMFYASVTMFFSFIILKIQNLFEWFITGVLHKSLTFTGRTLIWERGIEWIKKSFIYGYGNEEQLLKKSKIGHINSCHNYFLDFLYSGGVIMLITILLIVYFTGKELNKLLVSDNNIIKKSAHILSGIVGGYFFIWFATPVHLSSISYMFFVFYIIYNLKNLKMEVYDYA